MQAIIRARRSQSGKTEGSALSRVLSMHIPSVGINDYFMVEEQLSKYLFCFGILFQVGVSAQLANCMLRTASMH